MATIDIIDTAARGYQLVWAEHSYLMKLATVPLLIKFVCDVAIFALGWDVNLLRMTLAMVPAYLAEGWMLAHLVRLIFMGQRWPFQPTGDISRDLPVLQEKARGIMGGMVLYTLIKMAIGAFAAYGYSLAEASGGTTMVAKHAVGEAASNAAAAGGGGLPATSGSHDNPISTGTAPEPSGLAALLSLMGLVVMVWGFRFLWVYIPVALNMQVKEYAKRIGGFGSSLQMIGIWLISFLPFFFVSGLFFSFVYAALNSFAPDLALFVFSLGRAAVDTILSLLVTAAMGFGIAALLKR